MDHAVAMSPSSAISRRTHSWSYVLGGVGVLAAAITPLVAVGTWLLLTDAELATDVAVTGDLMPLALAIAGTLGEALRGLVAYL